MATLSSSSSLLLLLDIDVTIGSQCLLKVFSGFESIVKLVVEEEHPCESISTRWVREGQRDVSGETVTVKIQALQMLQLTEL